MERYTKGSEWRKWDLHLHTASSYDYGYKGTDADETIVTALRENDICAVAITDHFLIDVDRIGNLRSLAPEIVFFPGVELRTDKGSNNLHVILIFSDQKDVAQLSNRFNVIMKQQKAKNSDDNERIYWDFNDIIEFAKDEDALITIHAGKKTNGIDKEIKIDSLPHKEAIKEEIAKEIDFFEMGKKSDCEVYHKVVFPDLERIGIAEKPMIMCSDNHDARCYNPKESLWIKADCTFAGLKQCIFQPSDRVYIGVIPPSLDRLTKNKRNTIKSISIGPVSSPKHSDGKWFNIDLPLNPNLVAIIGNKGSGKSAFSDILGHLCNSHTMEHASFLNDKRFRNPKTSYANDYEASIEWEDNHKEGKKLDDVSISSSIETAQYLPQAYIEKVCNDIGDEFQKEINKVIFSYVDPVERGSATNLNELVSNKTYENKTQRLVLINKLQSINSEIIKLEHKKTKSYKDKISAGLQKLQNDLERLEKNKPVEVSKPNENAQDEAYNDELKLINNEILLLSSQKDECLREIARINELVEATNIIISELATLGKAVDEAELKVKSFIKNYAIDCLSDKLVFESPIEDYKNYLAEIIEQKKRLYATLQGEDNEPGIDSQIANLKTKREKHIEQGSASEKKYQKYLLDLQEWESQKKQLLGDEHTDETIGYYKAENEFINHKLEEKYKELYETRKQIALDLFELKKSYVDTYNGIYRPIQHEIESILNEMEEKISFEAEVQLTDDDFISNTLRYINQRYSGVFGGKTGANDKMRSFIDVTSFESFDSVHEMLENVLQVIYEDFDSAENKVKDRQGFYDFLFSLDYIGVNFELKFGDRVLSELSPGERGTVLLIFYLALSKENSPILVDQPEDNLDNQSVFKNLVPCIKKAKEKRQVIIVTHNPNIAIACDAEQIVYCEMDKENYQIHYAAGSIENSDTRKHVVDVLEGTEPAFELRRKKYFEKLGN